MALSTHVSVTLLVGVFVFTAVTEEGAFIGSVRKGNGVAFTFVDLIAPLKARTLKK